MEEGAWSHRRGGDESERSSVDSGLNLRPVHGQYEKWLLCMNRRKSERVCMSMYVCKSFSFHLYWTNPMHELMCSSLERDAERGCGERGVR